MSVFEPKIQNDLKMILESVLEKKKGKKGNLPLSLFWSKAHPILPAPRKPLPLPWPASIPAAQIVPGPARHLPPPRLGPHAQPARSRGPASPHPPLSLSLSGTLGPPVSVSLPPFLSSPGVLVPDSATERSSSPVLAGFATSMIGPTPIKS